MYDYSTLVAHPYDTSVPALKTVQTYSRKKEFINSRLIWIKRTSYVQLLQFIYSTAYRRRHGRREIQRELWKVQWDHVGYPTPWPRELEPQGTSFKLSAELSVDSLPVIYSRPTTPKGFILFTDSKGRPDVIWLLGESMQCICGASATSQHKYHKRK